MQTRLSCWLLLAACSGERTFESAPSTSSSSSALAAASSSGSALLDPVASYCSAIEQQWQTIDSHCTDAQRGSPDYAQARAAVTTAITKCRALLAPSHAAGRIAFEKTQRYPNYDCQHAYKYEWAAVGPLTRLQSNCSGTKLAGLGSVGALCRYSFECRSEICEAPDGKEGRCRRQFAENEDCSNVDATGVDISGYGLLIGAAAVCKEGLYCDRAAPSEILAGYPTGERSRSSDYPIRAGRVSIEALSEEAAPKPDIAEWSKERRPFLVRCFEAALAKDAKTKGAVTLDLPLEGPRKVVAADLPDELRDCALSSTGGYRKWAGRVRVRFDAAPSDKPFVPRTRTGKCRPLGGKGQACELNADCTQWFACNERKCEWEGPADCTTDRDCWLTQQCTRGQCVPRTGVGGACKVSADCLAGVCEAGVCKAMCASKSGPRFDPD